MANDPALFTAADLDRWEETGGRLHDAAESTLEIDKFQ